MAKQCEECGAELAMGNDYVLRGRHVCQTCLDRLDPTSKPASPAPPGARRARLAALFFFVAGICFLGVSNGDPSNPAIFSVVSLALMGLAGIGAIVGRNPRSSRGLAIAGLIVAFVALVLGVVLGSESFVAVALACGIIGLVLSLIGIALVSRAAKPV
jgi:hypothetical protein